MIAGANYKIRADRQDANMLGYTFLTLVDRRKAEVGKKSNYSLLYEWVCFTGDDYFVMLEEELFEYLAHDYTLPRSGKHSSSHRLGYDYNFSNVKRDYVD